jgi:hypothetical protein
MYSCETSAPVTLPLLVIFAVTVATVSKRSMEPPTPFVDEAGPAVGFPSTVISEYVKFVYAIFNQLAAHNNRRGI